MKERTIEHLGIIDSIDSGVIRVNVIAESACASCHAKNACSIGNVENKLIEINSEDISYANGESVIVTLSQSLGFKALFYGYLIPLMIIFMFLITLTLSGVDEGLAGLFAIAPLPVYYYVLYSLRKKMKRVFTFSIHKIS